MNPHWALTYSCDPTRCLIPTGIPLTTGQILVTGREGELPLGIDPPDTGVSRRAATITATPTGWQVEITNRNGAVLHPWGQAPVLAQRHNTLSWPRVGIRFLGSHDDTQHWVLLESDSITPTAAGAVAPTHVTTWTDTVDRPRPLTPAQVEALTVVFAAQLQWPPAQPALPLQLKQAARRLGVTESAVQDRLGKAHERALQLGLHRPVGLTDPDYLHLLVRAGYLPPPSNHPHRHHLH